MMWDNIVSAMAGGLIGASGALTSQWLAHHLNDSRTRRAIAGAFAGEIGAICSIVRRRKYLEFGQHFLEVVKQSQQPRRIVISITQEYFLIYHSNAGTIGILPSRQALDVARFYTQLKALMEDVRPDAIEPASVEGAIAHLTEQITLLTETLKVGENLVEQLQEVAK